ncbi:putative peroxin 11c protein [Daldinia childiae]|uniref:putative peroxin 11c protein n=1 Tax=Daldinia childiae TaxID=326645 RepID=UPI001447FF3B|nr:putative peroxin 11c protein [Daldinia childiae]KAF3059622.1 putative peroxin 11c protein [Daldinia childiae]
MSATEITTSATADLPSGDPVPSAIPLPVAKPKPFPIKEVITAAPSNIDAFLAHLQRCLQTPSGIDTTLLFLCYSSRFSASILEHLTRPAIQRSAQQLLALAASLPPSATLVFTAKALPGRGAALALVFAKRLRALSAMVTDARTFLRLWGLLNMYFWLRRLVAKKTEAETEKDAGKKTDKLETAISWFQLSTCIIFQALENGAYLSSKGVLGWAPATQRRASLWSARFWAAFVGAEVGRLLYENRKRGQRTRAEKFADGKTASEVQIEETEWTATWRKTLLRNLAWAPLTLHWSSETGLLGETAVGALACVPGVIQMRDLWRRTAAE